MPLGGAGLHCAPMPTAIAQSMGLLALARLALLALPLPLALAACAPSTPQPVAPTTTVADPATADAPPDPACTTFSERLCERLGAESAVCMGLREAVALMSPAACQEAVASLPFSLARVEVLRRDCLTVAERLCARVGEQTEVCAKLREDMASSVPPGHCGRLLAEYPALEARLVSQLERDRPLSDELRQAIVAGDPPAYGPADAKVTLVEFSDFQCPYCAMAAQTIQQVKDQYPDRVRIVFRQFPLSFHEHAQAAAEASLAAHAQGKFWPLHDLIFANQSELSPKALRGYAEQAGLDLAVYDKALTDSSYAAAVTADLALGEQVQVSGTPTLFLNGKRVPNPTDFAEVAPLIDAALAAASPAPAAPTPAAPTPSDAGAAQTP